MRSEHNVCLSGSTGPHLFNIITKCALCAVNNGKGKNKEE